MACINLPYLSNFNEIIKSHNKIFSGRGISVIYKNNTLTVKTKNVTIIQIQITPVEHSAKLEILQKQKVDNFNGFTIAEFKKMLENVLTNLTELFKNKSSKSKSIKQNKTNSKNRGKLDTNSKKRPHLKEGKRGTKNSKKGLLGKRDTKRMKNPNKTVGGSTCWNTIISILVGVLGVSLYGIVVGVNEDNNFIIIDSVLGVAFSISLLRMIYYMNNRTGETNQHQIVATNELGNELGINIDLVDLELGENQIIPDPSQPIEIPPLSVFHNVGQNQSTFVFPLIYYQRHNDGSVTVPEENISIHGDNSIIDIIIQWVNGVLQVLPDELIPVQTATRVGDEPNINNSPDSTQESNIISPDNISPDNISPDRSSPGSSSHESSSPEGILPESSSLSTQGSNNHV